MTSSPIFVLRYADARSHRIPPVQNIMTVFPSSFFFVSGSASHDGKSVLCAQSVEIV